MCPARPHITRILPQLHSECQRPALEHTVIIVTSAPGASVLLTCLSTFTQLTLLHLCIDGYPRNSSCLKMSPSSCSHPTFDVALCKNESSSCWDAMSTVKQTVIWRFTTVNTPCWDVMIHVLKQSSDFDCPSNPLVGNKSPCLRIELVRCYENWLLSAPKAPSKYPFNNM